VLFSFAGDVEAEVRHVVVGDLTQSGTTSRLADDHVHQQLEAFAAARHLQTHTDYHLLQTYGTQLDGPDAIEA